MNFDLILDVSRFLNSGTLLISGGTNDFLEEWEMDEIGALTFIKRTGLNGRMMVIVVADNLSAQINSQTQKY